MITLKDFHLYKGVVITQSDGDMGDAPQRTSFYHVAKAALGEGEKANFILALSYWQVEPGVLIRDPTRWDDPADFSRDQQDAVISAMLMYEMEEEAWEIIEKHWQRFGKYQNKDWAGPQNIALELRALKWGGSFAQRLFLTVLDVGFVIGALISCVKAQLKKDVDGRHLDMDNAITRLTVCSRRFPTPCTWLAKRIFRWFYPHNVGSSIEGFADFPLAAAVANKNQAKHGANPAMARLWLPVIAKEFYGVSDLRREQTQASGTDLS